MPVSEVRLKVPLKTILEHIGTDHWSQMGFSKSDLLECKKTHKKHLSEEARDELWSRVDEYDLPRARYFMERYLQGLRVPAIKFTVFQGCIDVYNGYHRLCGAEAAGVKEIEGLFHPWCDWTWIDSAEVMDQIRWASIKGLT
jgi:hypothetical protein